MQHSNSIPFLTQTRIHRPFNEQLHPNEKKNTHHLHKTLCNMYKSVDCKTIDSNGHNTTAAASLMLVCRFTCTSSTVDNADNADNVQGLHHAPKTGHVLNLHTMFSMFATRISVTLSHHITGTRKTELCAMMTRAPEGGRKHDEERTLPYPHRLRTEQW